MQYFMSRVVVLAVVSMDLEARPEERASLHVLAQRLPAVAASEGLAHRLDGPGDSHTCR